MKNPGSCKLKGVIALLTIVLTGFTCTNQQNDKTEKKVSAEASRIAPLFKYDSFQDENQNILPYRYFEPEVTGDSVAKFPVILYLHGEADFGTDNEAQLTSTECATIWVDPEHFVKYPAYVLAPQAPVGSDWTSEPVYSNTLAMLNRFVEAHPNIDENRICIVGFSGGATGVWNMILKNPNLFAFALPISGNADGHLGDYEAWAALKNLPVYVIHSYDDPISPVSGTLNALEALKAGGNKYVGEVATTSLWRPGSTSSPHEAWYTAFHKYEVIYHSLFAFGLEGTQKGTISPTRLFTKRDLGNGITAIFDYGINSIYVIERQDKAIIIDAGMGDGDLYRYIKDNVLKNKDIDLEIFITYNHHGHTAGISSFVGSSQLKALYVNEVGSEMPRRLIGPDVDKMRFTRDGEKIPFGGSEIEIIDVPGHALGSNIMKYENYLFSGDAIGTGYIGCTAISVEEYIHSVQHLLDKMGDEKYTLYGGHIGECTKLLNEQYVFDLMNCAKGLVDGSITGTPYWRNDRMVATVGDASITYDLNNVHMIKGALYSLAVSEGNISPAFAKYLSYYSAEVDEKTDKIDITPTVLAKDYQALTINGYPVVSGSAHQASLVRGNNRFSIVVTAADNTDRTYTLTITRGN